LSYRDEKVVLQTPKPPVAQRLGIQQLQEEKWGIPTFRQRFLRKYYTIVVRFVQMDESI